MYFYEFIIYLGLWNGNCSEEPLWGRTSDKFAALARGERPAQGAPQETPAAQPAPTEAPAEPPQEPQPPRGLIPQVSLGSAHKRIPLLVQGSLRLLFPRADPSAQVPGVRFYPPDCGTAAAGRWGRWPLAGPPKLQLQRLAVKSAAVAPSVGVD